MVIGLLYKIVNKVISKGLYLYHKSMVDYYKSKGILAGHDFTFDGCVKFMLHPNSHLVIGNFSTICDGSRIIVEEGLSMVIGDNCYVSHNCTISGEITMGSSCLVGANTMILDADHRFDDRNVPIKDQGTKRKAIIIGDDVWIGSGCVILKGSKIGSHSVIGANTTIAGEVPDWSIATGPHGHVKGLRP